MGVDGERRKRRSEVMHRRKILPPTNHGAAERNDLSPNLQTPLNLIQRFSPTSSSIASHPHSLHLSSPLPRYPSWLPPDRLRGWSPTAALPSCPSARPQTSLPQQPAQQPQRVPLSPISVCPRPSAGTRALSLRWTRPANTSSWPRFSVACTSRWSSILSLREYRPRTLPE